VLGSRSATPARLENEPNSIAFLKKQVPIVCVLVWFSLIFTHNSSSVPCFPTINSSFFITQVPILSLPNIIYSKTKSKRNPKLFFNCAWAGTSSPATNLPHNNFPHYEVVPNGVGQFKIPVLMPAMLSNSVFLHDNSLLLIYSSRILLWSARVS